MFCPAQDLHVPCCPLTSSTPPLHTLQPPPWGPQVYKSFIEAVDAVDNGVNQWDAAGPPRYVNNTTLGARVGRLNPMWSEEGSEDVLYQQFLKVGVAAGTGGGGAVPEGAPSCTPARVEIVTDGPSYTHHHPCHLVSNQSLFSPSPSLPPTHPLLPPAARRLSCLAVSLPRPCSTWQRHGCRPGHW